MEIEKLADGLYSVFTDQSKSCGILHFTHEISLVVRLNREKKKVGIEEGWEIAAEDIDWCPGDEDYFEYLHPGILSKIYEQIIALG